jgi:hypothetical protein
MRDTYNLYNIQFLLLANDRQEGNIQVAITLKTKDTIKTQETS